jgi:aminomethyltransferase
MSTPHRTPLYDTHVSAGGRMVEFGGWNMPVQYGGILEEHQAVRERLGVFDISHMGEFIVQGPGAAKWLDFLLTNQASSLPVGEGHYTLMLQENGGVIDDLLLYRTGEEEFLLIVNAAKIDEDAAWVQRHLPADGSVVWANRSASFVGLAVQGPESGASFAALFGGEMPPRNAVQGFDRDERRGWVATTGYTGEAGFEIFLEVPTGEEVPAAEKLWQAVLATGAVPCGLGARDTLRLEMGYPLNGSDLSPERTPVEAGLSYFVAWDKPDFLGRATLLDQRENGAKVKLCGLSLEGKGPPPRPHYPVWSGANRLGETTSGALSPSLQAGIAMAYLPGEFAKVGTEVEIEIRGRKFPARVCRKPFYKKD